MEHFMLQIQLTANQLQQIALQMQGKQPGHPIVIQTASSIDQQNANSMDQGGHQFSNQASPYILLSLLKCLSFWVSHYGRFVAAHFSTAHLQSERKLSLTAESPDWCFDCYD